MRVAGGQAPTTSKNPCCLSIHRISTPHSARNRTLGLCSPPKNLRNTHAPAHQHIQCPHFSVQDQVCTTVPKTLHRPPLLCPPKPQPLLIFPCHYSPVLLNLFFFLSSRTRTAAFTLPVQSLIPLFAIQVPRNIFLTGRQTPPVQSRRHPNSWLNLLGSTLHANLNPVVRDQVSATKQDNSLHSP